MLKVFLVAVMLLIGIKSKAQNSIAAESSKLLKTIERNFNLSSDDKTDKASEFFLYSIILDTCGKISNIDILGRDSSSYIKEIKRLIPEIKKNWRPVKSDYKLILVPVMIINTINEESDTGYDISTKEIATFFQLLTEKSPSNRVYTSKTAIITYYRQK